MAFGDFARLDGYDPNAAFPPGSPADEARWAREAAAARLGLARRQQDSGAARSERVMGAIADIAKAVVDPIVTEATDYSRGRVAPAGPMTEEEAFRINRGNIGRVVPEMAMLRAPLRNPLGPVTQAELRGGTLYANAPKRTRAPTGYDPVGWQGPVSDIAEAGHIPRGTHANWYMRHDPQGNVTLSNESGWSGNKYGVNLKGGMTPDEMAHYVGQQEPAIIPKGREFDLDELRRQKAEFVFGPTDAMASGGWLDLPGGAVKQEGGIGFMQAHKDVKIPGMPDDVQPLYASVSKAAASKANAVAEDVIKRGGVPIYAPVVMGPGAGDSTKQMAFSVLSALRHADPTPTAIETLDAAVRAKGKGAKGYPGYNSPELSDWLSTSGLKGRRAFTEGAAARSAIDETGVDVSLLRYLNTDPRLRHTPSGSAGAVLGRMRPDVGITEHPLHSNYPATFMGQKGEIGGLPGNMPFSQIAPDMFRGLLKYRSPGGGLFADTPAIQVMRGLASDVPQTQPVTKEVVDNWRRWFDRNPQGWAIPGAVGLGALADERSYRQP
jgi:hypothetical protein